MTGPANDLELGATWYWIHAMLDCLKRGIEFDESRIHALLDDLRTFDPVEEAPDGFTPEEWDRENTLRYPYVERAGLMIIDRLKNWEKPISSI